MLVEELPITPGSNFKSRVSLGNVTIGLKEKLSSFNLIALFRVKYNNTIYTSTLRCPTFQMNYFSSEYSKNWKVSLAIFYAGLKIVFL